MPAPDDPAAFIAAAERGINERDLDATASVYAERAYLESVTDGAIESHSGAAAIREAWGAYLEAMEKGRFTLAKNLVGATEDLIVNEWVGTLGGRTEARGIEYWVFDADGKVAEHRLYSFLNARASTNPLQRLRLLLTYPRTALAFLRAQSRRR